VDSFIGLGCLIGLLSMIILAIVYVMHEMWIRGG
jgi:hypothetical protein